MQAEDLQDGETSFMGEKTIYCTRDGLVYDISGLFDPTQTILCDEFNAVVRLGAVPTRRKL